MSLDTFFTDLREKKSDTFTENELKRLFSVISELLGGKKIVHKNDFNFSWRIYTVVSYSSLFNVSEIVPGI